MEASNAMFSRLNQITLADLIAGGKDAQADICDAEAG
jgi:DNA-binding IscR family transcriptional regulator